MNTKMHSNFGHKNRYVSSIPNSFTQLVMQTPGVWWYKEDISNHYFEH